MAANMANGIDSGLERPCNPARLVGLQSGLKLGRNLQELAVAGFPNVEEWAGVQTAFNGPAAVQPFFERLVHQVLFEPLPARILEDAGQPNTFLPVQF